MKPIMASILFAPRKYGNRAKPGLSSFVTTSTYHSVPRRTSQRWMYPKSGHKYDALDLVEYRVLSRTKTALVYSLNHLPLSRNRESPGCNPMGESSKVTTLGFIVPNLPDCGDRPALQCREASMKPDLYPFPDLFPTLFPHPSWNILLGPSPDASRDSFQE